MFARPVDPFLAYNSALSAAERHHKEMLTRQDGHPSYSHQELGQQSPPHLDSNQSFSSKRRKHSLHFEPEFLSALDSSLQDPVPAPSRLRPSKKLRRSAAASHDYKNHIDSNTTNNNHTKSIVQSRMSPLTVPETQGFPTTTPLLFPTKPTDGPSIIDLSSGEELIAMNIGQNDHKRPRETSESSSTTSMDSLREVYDVLEDGSLHPVLDHAPALPSPAKRSRIDPSEDGPLRQIEEWEQERECKRPNRRSFARARYSSVNNISGDSDDLMESANRKYENDDHSDSKNTCPPTPASRPQMALIRYEGPKTMAFSDGVDAMFRKCFHGEDNDIINLSKAKGNELVLYRPPAQVSRDKDDKENRLPLTIIEELDDDDIDIYRAPSNEDSDILINELEDKIMDMDLD
ncbi:hypothetical protein FBU30_008622 [Linnemannia zychae]|nr:hypothetical protein FBU30_008622 [Linnemannia zychae]